MALMKPFNPDSRAVAIIVPVDRDVQNYLIEINSGDAWVPVENQPGWTRFNQRKEDIAGDYWQKSSVQISLKYMQF